MDVLKEKFQRKAFALRKELNELVKEHGETVVSEVRLKQIFKGARGIPMIFWEGSSLDAIKGIRFHGYNIPDLQKLLPRVAGGTQPLPEGLFWLLLTGEIPTQEQVDWLSAEWKKRGTIPAATIKVLDSLPENMHPMTQFCIAIETLQTESIFTKRYAEGMHKLDYWDPTYEDTMNLIARLPALAAYIYRNKFHSKKLTNTSSDTIDWAGNFAELLGFQDESFKSLMRLYMTIHADHEGGNASAHATYLVGSTLSDPYLSLAAGMTALAGPLHGLANQETIKWILQMLEDLGTKTPSKDQIINYAKATLAAGRIIPGYGHGVLRVPDPRFMAQKAFAEQYLKDAELVQIVWTIFEVVPPLLTELGKVSNPYPNVDAHSGALLVHYGLTEYHFYTVLFGVSRALGVLTALCWSRALGLAIERPKSITADWVRSVAKMEVAG